jgi:hypothetical protein
VGYGDANEFTNVVRGEVGRAMSHEGMGITVLVLVKECHIVGMGRVEGDFMPANECEAVTEYDNAIDICVDAKVYVDCATLGLNSFD